MDWGKLLALVGAVFIVWILYRYVAANPAMLSKEKLAKSFYTMGLLSLGLIAFIAICIWMLRIT